MPKAIIVGASRGLGLGLVEELARRGWEVLATVRDPDGSPELNQLALGGKARIERLDVVDPQSALRLRDNLEGETFDLVFVNAGMAARKGTNITNVDDDSFGLLFETNALGPVRTAEQLIGKVAPNTGVVAFMSSRLGSVADRTSDHAELYSASKAALNSLVRAYAARHAEKGLAVLAIHPGWVKTEIGGDAAPLDVETSARSVVEVIEQRRKDRASGFYDHSGAVIPW